MKRDAFLKRLMSIGAVMTVAPLARAEKKRTYRGDKGFLVPAGKDRFDKSISLMEGDTFFTKISSKDTNGDLYVFESIRVKKGGPALHVHEAQDE